MNELGFEFDFDIGDELEKYVQAQAQLKSESKSKSKSGKLKLQDNLELARRRYKYLQGTCDEALREFDVEFQRKLAKHPDWFVARVGDKIVVDDNLTYWHGIEVHHQYIYRVPARDKFVREFQAKLDSLGDRLRVLCRDEFPRIRDVEFMYAAGRVVMQVKARAHVVRDTRKEIQAEKEFRREQELSATLKYRPVRAIVDMSIAREWMPDILDK
jgi:hypothetical protein